MDRSLVQQGRVLGSGEFGEVFKGVLTKPGQPPMEVALKTLKKAENKDESLSEARIMMQMVSWPCAMGRVLWAVCFGVVCYLF